METLTGRVIEVGQLDVWGNERPGIAIEMAVGGTIYLPATPDECRAAGGRLGEIVKLRVLLDLSAAGVTP